MSQRSRSVAPCPGILQTTVVVAAGPAAAFGLGNPKNVGSCPLSIAGVDVRGRPIMPSLSLQPGESVGWFSTPPGTTKIVFTGFDNCSGEAILEFDAPNS